MNLRRRALVLLRRKFRRLLVLCSSWRIGDLLLPRSFCLATSVPSWSDGRTGRISGLHSVRGLCWPAPRACRTRRWRGRSGCRYGRRAGGGRCSPRRAGWAGGRRAGRAPEGGVGALGGGTHAAAAVGAAGEDRPVPGAAREDRAGVRGGRDEQAGRRRAAASTPPTVQQVAGGSSSCRLDGLSDEPRPGRPPSITLDQVEEVVSRRWSPDARRTRHALVAGVDGPAQRAVEVDDRPDLAGVRSQAAPAGHLQAVHRPAVRRQGRRRRRPLPQPAREGGGAVRGREVPDPGPGPVPAGAADDARHARAAHPRLPPPRHHQPVRRVQHRRRHRHRRTAPPPPGRGVQEVPDHRSTRPSPPSSTCT